MAKRRTKIVATLGPALDDYERLKAVFKLANVARFNFSHGSHKEHEERLKMVREIEEELGKPITTMADTKGPEVRTQNKESLEVKKGTAYSFDDFQFQPRDAMDIAEEGDVVFMDDGKLIFRVEEGKLKALTSGTLKPRRGVIIKGKEFDLPSFTERDKEDLAFIKKAGFDAVAQSFVRTERDYDLLREFVGEDIITVAKIETSSAVKNLSRIIEKYDGVMVARGDLALSIDIEELPLIQKDIIRKAKKHLKFSIVATQMLESMTHSPFPLRSEVTDIYEAVSMGADAVMLSGETSAGKYPVEAVKMMDKIAKEAEEELLTQLRHWEEREHHFQDYKNIIAFSAVNMGIVLRAPVIAPTMHGTTPRKLSALRSGEIIYSITPVYRTYKLLNFYHGVYPKLGEFEPVFDNFEKIKALFGVEKAVFVFGYPPGNHRTNAIIYI